MSSELLTWVKISNVAETSRLSNEAMSVISYFVKKHQMNEFFYGHEGHDKTLMAESLTSPIIVYQVQIKKTQIKHIISVWNHDFDVLSWKMLQYQRFTQN